MGVMQGCCWVVENIVPIVSNAFNFLSWLYASMDRASALVHALCSSRVHRVS